MDENETEFPVAVTADEASHPNGVRYGAETGDEIVRRTAAGESLASICASEGMPTSATICQWAREREEFAARLHAARLEAGGPFKGRRALWCEATAQAIYDRVCAGEALTRICAEVGMPSMSTLTNWRRDHPEFAEAMDEAYEIRAETWFDRGWEMAQAVTPSTAYASEVQLRHLRWYVGKLGPRKYGPVKAMAIPEPPEPKKTFYIRRFEVETNDEGGRRVVELKPHFDTGQVERIPLGPFGPPIQGKMAGS